MTITANQKIADRIKKLLALATSANPHEAAQAAAEAQRLMVEHDLSEACLEEGPGPVVEHVVQEPDGSSRACMWRASLADKLGEAMGVKVLYTVGSSRLRSFGRSRTGLLTEQWAALPEALLAFAARFLRVQVEHADALVILRRYDAPTTLHYADPPYLPAVRSRWAGHAYEEETSPEKHIALAEALHQSQGFALVSGYPSPLYTELYEQRGWRREERRAFNVAGRPITEALWLCPKTQAALAHAAGPLFASAQGAAP